MQVQLTNQDQGFRCSQSTRGPGLARLFILLCCNDKNYALYCAWGVRSGWSDARMPRHLRAIACKLYSGKAEGTILDLIAHSNFI